MFGETQIPRNLFGILFRIWEKPLTSFSMKINIHCSSGGKGVPMKPVKLKWVKGKGKLGERLLFLAVTWVCKPGPAPTVSSGHCWHSATSCALCLLCTPLPEGLYGWVLGDWHMPDQLRTRNGGEEIMAVFSPSLAQAHWEAVQW